VAYLPVAFRLFNGKAAEGELKGLAEATANKHTDHDLLRHNMVVFKGGEGAVQVTVGAVQLLV
jgi:intraflagellar transport protein 56